MRNKISTSRARIDEITEFFQQNKSSAAKNISFDKRTVRSTQSAEKLLSGKYKASQIAQDLGIKTQKWVSIRKQIREGKIFSPEIRDYLRQEIQVKKEEIKQEKQKYREEKPYLYKVKIENEDGTTVTRRAWVYPSMDNLKENVPWAQEIKLLPDLKQAAEWWATISAGADYFVLAAAGDGGFWVVDIRTPEEKTAEKGKLNGATRAREILEKYNDEY
jgi:hypothetical protein